MIGLRNLSLNIWSKSGQLQLRYFYYGQMSPGQMFYGQSFTVAFGNIQDGPRNLPLKFGQKRVSNSWDIVNIEFFLGWWVCKVIFVSNLQLQCGLVGIVTTSTF